MRRHQDGAGKRPSCGGPARLGDARNGERRLFGAASVARSISASTDGTPESSRSSSGKVLASRSCGRGRRRSSGATFAMATARTANSSAGDRPGRDAGMAVADEDAQRQFVAFRIGRSLHLPLRMTTESADAAMNVGRPLFAGCRRA